MNLRNARGKVIAGSLLTAGLVTGGAIAVSGTALAAEPAAGSTSTATPSDSTTGSADPAADPAPGTTSGTVDRSKSRRWKETLLTGTDAEQATAAALAAYPGATIQRVETDSDGVFEAHLVTTDGQVLIVQMDVGFVVTGTQERGGPGDGRGGPGHGRGGRGGPRGAAAADGSPSSPSGTSTGGA